MVNVPSQYQPLIEDMSKSTGIPKDVIAVQANVESGFKSTAVSPAGAEGWLQFMPGTYDSNAQAAGVKPGTEFNPKDESKVYDVFMGGLLKRYKGNLRDALAAYNAGPGNIQAGMGYADEILAQAGGNPGKITTTSVVGDVGGAVGKALGGGLSISGILGNVLGDMSDVLERLGLILLGAALILLGIHILAGGSGNSPAAVIETSGGGSTPAPSKKAGKGGVVKTGASEAAEAAAVA